MAASKHHQRQLPPTPQPRPVRAVCVASGKGGVGKTNVTINLGLSLAKRGKRVMILDADLGLANVDVLLGLKTNGNLSHVIRGERSLADIILDGPDGLKIVPASSGIQRMAELSTAEHTGVIDAFGELHQDLDLLLVDAAAGISSTVTNFGRACQEIIVVINDDPASFTDAYALIKLLSQDYGSRRFYVLANRVSSTQAGRELFEQLFKVCDRFLDLTLHFLGAVPEDGKLQRAVKAQRPVVGSYPDSLSALAFRRLAEQFERLPWARAASGGLQFFFERLVMAGALGKNGDDGFDASPAFDLGPAPNSRPQGRHALKPCRAPEEQPL